MTAKPVLVVGATGKTGRRVVAQLTALGIPVRAASRSGQQRFDWLDRSTWKAALDGVSGVYVVPPDGTTTVPAFLELAGASDVERLVLLSARGVDVPGYFGDVDVEGMLLNERAVRSAGPDWTILRPGWFAQNFSEGVFRDGILGGELRLAAGDGATSFVDTVDIAAVAVAALLQDGHAGRTYELSGPAAVTTAEAVAQIAEATGRQVRYVPVPAAQFVRELVEQGLSPAEAELWTAALSPVERGLEAKISDGVPAATGREPRDFSAFVKAAVAEGAWR